MRVLLIVVSITLSFQKGTTLHWHEADGIKQLSNGSARQGAAVHSLTKLILNALIFSLNNSSWGKNRVKSLITQTKGPREHKALTRWFSFLPLPLLFCFSWIWIFKWALFCLQQFLLITAIILPHCSDSCKQIREIQRQLPWLFVVRGLWMAVLFYWEVSLNK